MVKTLKQTLKISAVSLLAVVAANKAFAMDPAVWEEQQRRAAMMGASAGYPSYPVASTMVQQTQPYMDPRAGGYPSYHGAAQAAAAPAAYYPPVSGVAAHPSYGAAAGTYDPRLQYSGMVAQASPYPQYAADPRLQHSSMGVAQASPSHHAAADPRDAQIAALQAELGKLKSKQDTMHDVTGEKLKLTEVNWEKEKERVKRRDATITSKDGSIKGLERELADLRRRLTDAADGAERRFATINKDYTVSSRENTELKKKTRTLVDENAALRLRVSSLTELHDDFSGLMQALMDEVETLRSRGPAAAAAPGDVAPSVARARAALAAPRAANRFVRDGRVNEEAGRIGANLLMKAHAEIPGCAGLADDPTAARGPGVKAALRTLLDDRDVQRMISYDPRKARRGAPDNPRAWSDAEFDAVVEAGIRTIEISTLALG